MAKKLQEAEREELRTLRDRFLLIIDFLSTHGLLAEVAAVARDEVNRAYAEEDLADLRSSTRDFNEWIRSLKPADQKELEALLLAQLGTNVEAERASDLDKVRAVVARGRILDDGEFYLVQERIDQLYADPTAAAEYERLGSLVLEYEDSRRQG